jgi:hypothetical protein
MALFCASAGTLACLFASSQHDAAQTGMSPQTVTVVAQLWMASLTLPVVGPLAALLGGVMWAFSLSVQSAVSVGVLLVRYLLRVAGIGPFVEALLCFDYFHSTLTYGRLSCAGQGQ